MGEISGPLDEDYKVQKCLPLLKAMQEVRFTRGEIGIMDTYVSRINSKNELDDTVVFSLNEYMSIAGLKSSHPEVVDNHTDGLLHKVIKIPVADIPPDSGIDFGEDCIDPKEGVFKFVLFDRCDIVKPDSGHWVIRVRCSREAKKLFFNFYHLGYIQYRLGTMLGLVGTGSCYLYMYLLKEIYKKRQWTVEVDELRDRWFHVGDRKAYHEFRYFRRDVLEPAVAEVNAKTELTCSWASITASGRTVTSIRFTVREKPKAVREEDNGGQISLPYTDTQSATVAMIMQISCKDDFSAKELSRIENALYEKVPAEEDSAKREDVYRYAYEQMLKAVKDGTKISSRSGYLAKTIKNMRDTMYSPEGDGDFSRDFERFWTVYPRKAEKVNASKTFKKVLHNKKAEGLTADYLILAAREYSKDCMMKKTEETYMYYAANFLLKGIYEGYLDQALARTEEEEQKQAEFEADLADPESEEQFEKMLRNHIHIPRDSEAESEESAESEDPAAGSKASPGTDEAAKLKAYWRKIRPSGFKWTEDEEKEIDDQIEDCLKRCSSGSITAVLKSAVKYHEKMPRFDLAGIIQPGDVQDVQVPEMP